MSRVPLHIIHANQKGEESARFGRSTPGHLTDRSLDPNAQEYQRLFKHMRKQGKRIKRLKLLIKGPETEGNALLYADTRARILKCEEIISNCIMKIKQREAEKERIHNREIKKKLNKRAIDNLEKVRLEKSQLVDYVAEEVKTVEPDENRNDHLSIFVKAKRSTEKTPVYEEKSLKQIEKEFWEKVHKPKPTPRPRKPKTDEPFPYMAKKRALAKRTFGIS